MAVVGVTVSSTHTSRKVQLTMYPTKKLSTYCPWSKISSEERNNRRDDFYSKMTVFLLKAILVMPQKYLMPNNMNGILSIILSVACEFCDIPCVHYI